MAYKSGGGQTDKREVNMVEYCRLKEVRANTALIGGRIFYDGRYWEEAEYEAKFPKPVIVYDNIQIDGRQIEK